MKLKLLFIFMSAISSLFAFVGASDVLENSQFVERSSVVQSINIYYNGNLTSMERNEDIMNSFEVLVNTAHEMPALGVAMQDETIEAIRSGLWVEFEFDGACYHNGLPYEKLLFCVEKDYTGFNLIRYFDGKYEGRCFYVNLNGKTMYEFYNAIFSFVN